MSDSDRLAEAKLALLALALVAWGHRRKSEDSPYQRRLAAELSQAHRVLADQREALELPYPGVLPEGPNPSKAFGS